MWSAQAGPASAPAALAAAPPAPTPSCDPSRPLGTAWSHRVPVPSSTAGSPWAPGIWPVTTCVAGTEEGPLPGVLPISGRRSAAHGPGRSSGHRPSEQGQEQPECRGRSATSGLASDGSLGSPSVSHMKWVS